MKAERDRLRDMPRDMLRDMPRDITDTPRDITDMPRDITDMPRDMSWRMTKFTSAVCYISRLVGLPGRSRYW